MQKILITGGSGLIGRHVIKRLSGKYEFTVVSRDPGRTHRLLGNNIDAVSIDDIESIERYYGVINLAGEPIADKRWTSAQKEKICQSRWQITEKLISLINQSPDKPRVFISGSAIGFYGRQDDQSVSEDFTDYHEEFSRHVCKRWEDIANEANTRVCTIRIGIVLAETGGALQKMLMPFRVGLGGPIGKGTQYMSWIHIDDIVRSIEFLLENENCDGPFNLTAPNPNTNHFFSLRLAERLERPCFFTVPAFVMKTLMGESSDLVLYGQKVIPTRLMNAGFSFTYPTLVEAFSHLDL
ncbi:MAG: TIGR01777 family oxidoreductase [Pseudomonadota bacterium]